MTFQINLALYTKNLYNFYRPTSFSKWGKNHILGIKIRKTVQSKKSHKNKIMFGIYIDPVTPLPICPTCELNNLCTILTMWVFFQKYGKFWSISLALISEEWFWTLFFVVYLLYYILMYCIPQWIQFHFSLVCNVIFAWKCIHESVLKCYCLVTFCNIWVLHFEFHLTILKKLLQYIILENKSYISCFVLQTFHILKKTPDYQLITKAISRDKKFLVHF